MPPLPDARYERFAQNIFQGMAQGEAYVAAGFAENRGNAGRARRRQDVIKRLAELQAAAAKKAIMTVADVVEQLGEDRMFAREMEAPSAAVTATMGQAKVLGLLSDKVEHTGKDGGPIEMEDATLARLIAFTLTKASREAPDRT